MKSNNLVTGDILDLYCSIGLTNGQLQKVQDLERLYDLHKIDVQAIEGYENLSVIEKQMFESFLINFLNRWGLMTRVTIRPLWIGWVEEISFTRQEMVNGEEVYCREGYQLYRFDGAKKILHESSGMCLKSQQKTPKRYLRFEYWHYRSSHAKDIAVEWLHVRSATEWY